MAFSFEYEINDPADYDLFLSEAQEQARINFQKIRDAYYKRHQEVGPDDAGVKKFKEMLADKELLVSKVMNKLAEQGYAVEGWQVITETQARRILRGLRDKAGRLVHPDMPGSQPPVAPRSGRPTSAGRPTSGGRPTSAPTSAGSIPTAEEALEIFRRLYPQFLAEMGGSNTERLYAGRGRY